MKYKYIIKVGVVVREIDSSWFKLEEYSGIVHSSYKEAKKEYKEACRKCEHVFMYRIESEE